LATKNYSFLPSSKRETLLGVDIGACAIKLIGLSLDNHVLQLELCAKIILNKNSTDQEIAALIRQQLDSNNKTSFKKAAVAIAADRVFFKKLNVSNLLSRREMEKFILFNIAREMNLQQKEISYAYELNSNHCDTINHTKLANIVAVKRSHIARLEKLLYAAGLMVKIADVDSYALLRAEKSDNLDQATVEQLSPEMLIAFGLALRIQDED
jgi:Tfp pilus assembly PilM family ATPase